HCSMDVDEILNEASLEPFQEKENILLMSL
ncbi:hypothetical protein BMETH_7271922125, partial [methanotrophic bacterial endosymbiont of Bathymodiolus sp.]